MHIMLELVIGALLVGLVVVGLVVAVLIKLLGGGPRSSGSASQQDEARIIQELYQGFERMERRIEALETLLLDKDGADPKGRRT